MSHISVYVRVRPVLQHELLQRKQQSTGHINRIEYSQHLKEVRAQITNQRQKVFQFNKVFTENYSQQEIFNQTEMPNIISKVLEGFHGTVFAYGQTGSGKTYTVEGELDNQEQGIIPRSIRQLFKQLSEKNHNERHYKVFISYLQIYNQNIFDLIDASDAKPLKMRWNKHQQFTVEDLFQGQCRTYQQAIKWWKRGKKNKIMGAHKMNKVSSRSHCILTLRVSSYQYQDPSNSIESKLQIIDLAGSQRHKVTKSSGLVFKEGVQINKSLFNLRQVISALYQISKGENTNRHIPYRQSKLTSLLKQSIGGNTFCTMIACLNPTPVHYEETFQTLTYASMASYISNIPMKNIDPKIKENQQLREQNRFLKNQVKKLTKNLEDLMKLLEQNVCINCKNRQADNQIDSANQSGMKLATHTQRRNNQLSQLAIGQSKQPAGLIRLPRFQSRKQTIIIDQQPEKQDQQVQKNTPQYKKYMGLPVRIPSLKHARNYTESDQNQTQKIRDSFSKMTNIKKGTSIKTKQQILQSINMLRDLIYTNSNLREKIDSLTNKIKQNQREIYYLVRQNQILRDRQDMINKVINLQDDQFQPQEKETHQKSSKRLAQNLTKRNKTSQSSMMIIQERQNQNDTYVSPDQSKLSKYSSEKRSRSVYSGIPLIKKATYNQFLEENNKFRKKTHYKKKKQKPHVSKHYQDSSFKN